MEVQDSTDKPFSPRQIQTLSWPRATTSTRAEASRLLRACTSTDAVSEFYLTFAKQKTVVPAMRHMESSGGHLDDLSFPTATFLNQGNVSRILSRTQVTGPLTSLSRVTAIYARLDQLLSDLEARLVARFEGRLMLLYGRALRVAYPDYDYGYSHDLDFFGLDTHLANDWLRTMSLDRELTLERSAISPVRNFARVKLLKREAEGFLLKADLIVGGRLGRGSIPPFTLNPLPRARLVHIRNKAAFVPSPEDMILMVAEKMRRNGLPLRRHFNDVRFLVLAHERDLDWDYIHRTAARHRLSGMMRWLTDDLRRQEGRELTPSAVLAEPRSAILESRMISLISEPTLRATWLNRPRVKRKLWRSYWFVRHLRPARDAFQMMVEQSWCGRLILLLRSNNIGEHCQIDGR